MNSSFAILVRVSLGAVVAFAGITAAVAEVKRFPAGFRTQELATDGATSHVRFGGQGPAVVLLHGFGDTGDMWAPVAAALAKRPLGGRSRSARHGALVPSRDRLRQEDPGARHCAGARSPQDRQGGA